MENFFFADEMLQGFIMGAIATGVIVSLYLCFKFSILATEYAYHLNCGQHRGMTSFSRNEMAAVLYKVKKMKWLAIAVVLATGWMLLPLPFYFITYGRIAAKTNQLCLPQQLFGC